MTLDECGRGDRRIRTCRYGDGSKLGKNFPYFDGNHHGSSSNYQKIMTYTYLFSWQCEENEEHGEVDYVVWFWWTLSSFWFHVHVNVWWWRQHAGDNASGLSCLESDPNSFQMFFVVLRFIFRPHVQTGSCWLVTLQFLPSGGLVNCSPHMFVSFKLALCFVMSGVSTMAQDTCSCRRLAVYPRVSWQSSLPFCCPRTPHPDILPVKGM